MLAAPALKAENNGSEIILIIPELVVDAEKKGLIMRASLIETAQKIELNDR
ncbi:MAG: hypothetical protein ACI87H_003525 [Gammaproteobacteria bacterium]